MGWPETMALFRALSDSAQSPAEAQGLPGCTAVHRGALSRKEHSLSELGQVCTQDYKPGGAGTLRATVPGRITTFGLQA